MQGHYVFSLSVLLSVPKSVPCQDRASRATMAVVRANVSISVPTWTLSPSSIIWYQRKLGSKQAYRVVHQPVSRSFAVFADVWLSGCLAEISADLRETVAH